MLIITPDSSSMQEIIRFPWEDEASETVHSEDSDWEILNETSEHDVLNRHWFKQNYVHQMPRSGAVVTYH